jgi:hypothetical protein
MNDGLITLGLIAEIVCAHYSCSRIDLVAHRRTELPTLARHVVWWLARRHTSLSYPAIGFWFSDRDHTTVLHGVRRVNALCASNPAFKAEIDEIEKALVILAHSQVSNLLHDVDAQSLAQKALRLHRLSAAETETLALAAIRSSEALEKSSRLVLALAAPALPLNRQEIADLAGDLAAALEALGYVHTIQESRNVAA